MRRMWGFSVEHVSSGNAIGAAHSVVDECGLRFFVFRLILSPLTVSQISSTDFSTAVRVLVSKRFVCCRIQCARADAAYSWLVAPLFFSDIGSYFVLQVCLRLVSADLNKISWKSLSRYLCDVEVTVLVVLLLTVSAAARGCWCCQIRSVCRARASDVTSRYHGGTPVGAVIVIRS